MWRGVGQTVGRENAVQAGASHPVMCFPMFAANVDILDAGCRGHDESLRGPGPVASLVEPGVVFYVQWELTFDLARAEITSPVDSAHLLNPGDSGVPQSLGRPSYFLMVSASAMCFT